MDQQIRSRGAATLENSGRIGQRRGQGYLRWLALLADVFALYLKTKNFHWHMSGSHFRDYHLLLSEHGGEDCSRDDRSRWLNGYGRSAAAPCGRLEISRAGGA